MKISILTNNYIYSDHIQKIPEESNASAASTEKEEVSFAETLKELSELLVKKQEELASNNNTTSTTSTPSVNGDINNVDNTGTANATDASEVVNPTKDGYQSIAPENLQEIYKKAANTYGVDQKLLELIGYRESRFRANATSAAGAMGIMQLMPGTAKGLGVDNAYDPEQNIMGAAKLIKRLWDQYNGNIDLVIAGYSAGTGAVSKYGGVPPYKETTDYVAWIKERYP